MLVCQGDCSIKKVEGEAAFLGLKDRPGELGDANHPKAKLAHAPEVVCPQGFGPLLRIVAHAQLKAIQMQRLRHAFNS